MLIHNSDNLKNNKLGSLLNIALSVTLASDSRTPRMARAGLLMIRFHTKTMQKSEVFIPEVWRFLIQVFEAAEPEVTSKTYQQVGWSSLLSNKEVNHTDLLYVLLKTTLDLLTFNKTNFVVRALKPIASKLKTKLNEDLLDHILKSLETTSAFAGEMDSVVPFMIKELTPRILSTEKSHKEDVDLLKRKKNKLKKRLIGDLRSRIHDKLQEESIKQEARRERVLKRHKKELFIIEKQTAEAKKLHRMKKITKASKDKSNKSK